jgi:hypothetical protein
VLTAKKHKTAADKTTATATAPLIRLRVSGRNVPSKVLATEEIEAISLFGETEPSSVAGAGAELGVCRGVAEALGSNLPDLIKSTSSKVSLSGSASNSRFK